MGIGAIQATRAATNLTLALTEWLAKRGTQKALQEAAEAAAKAGVESWTRAVARSGSKTLTPLEAFEIQAISNKYKTTIDVVGSRAKGEGRNIETDLPSHVKGDNTRSDIDFRIDTNHPRVAEIIEDLKRVGNGAGSAGMKWSTADRDTVPPFMRFEPDK